MNYLISFIYQYVEGIEGIMAAYSSALHNVALAGPTLFGQVINKVAQIASQSHLIQQQQVLCFAHYYGKENFNFFFFFRERMIVDFIY